MKSVRHFAPHLENKGPGGVFDEFGGEDDGKFDFPTQMLRRGVGIAGF